MTMLIYSQDITSIFMLQVTRIGFLGLPVTPLTFILKLVGHPISPLIILSRHSQLSRIKKGGPDCSWRGNDY